MKIFLDTANINEIIKFVELGLCDGVTTNPTWISKDTSDKKFKDIVLEICSAVKGPVSAEAVSTNYDELLEEARQIATWAKNIVVKIPCTDFGLRATKTLSQEGIKINVTLVNSAAQAMFAAKANAYFVSPFMGRLYDAGYNGLEIVKDTVEIFKQYNFSTQVLAASFREPREIVDVAKMGCHIATVKPEFLEKVLNNPFTAAGLKSFLDDWEKVKAAGKA